MPRYDPDLIAALAEGRLDPDEAAALEREVASDPVASAELAAHRLVLETIAATEAPRMTMAERSQLRESVASALGVTAAEHTATASAPTRRVPWGSLGIAAAALAGLVAIVPVVGLLSTGGSDDTASFELAAEVPTTAATDADAARAQDSAESAAVVAEGEIDDALTLGGDSADAATFAPSTTLRATTTTAAAQSESAPAATTTTPAPTTTTTAVTTTSTTAGTTTTAASAEVQQLTSELKGIKGDPADVEARSSVAGSTTACWAADSGTRGDPPPVYAFSYANSDFDVVVYFVYSAGQAGPFQVWNRAGCGSVVVVP
jgi:hypothetical protein